MPATAVDPGKKAYDLKAFDIIVFVEAAIFSALSFARPDTGFTELFGKALTRGWVAGTVTAFIALAALLFPLINPRKAHPVVLFVRTFYPQAVTAVFFFESILLSSVLFGGRSFDAFFASLDQRIFGFQPSREFSAAFRQFGWINELMFGSYFSYFVFLTITPWIPWLFGRRAEAERQIFAWVALSGLLDLWYLAFRVQGPKYWFADLHAAWYGDFHGGLFVRFFQGMFENATLSGAAFPSSHVAEMTLFTLFAWRIDKRLFGFYVVMTALIAAATVYLYAHYAVDAIAGFIVAMTLGPLLLRAWKPAEDLAGRLARGRGGQAVSTAEGRR